MKKKAICDMCKEYRDVEVVVKSLNGRIKRNLCLICSFADSFGLKDFNWGSFGRRSIKNAETSDNTDG